MNDVTIYILLTIACLCCFVMYQGFKKRKDDEQPSGWDLLEGKNPNQPKHTTESLVKHFVGVANETHPRQVKGEMKQPDHIIVSIPKAKKKTTTKKKTTKKTSNKNNTNIPKV